MNIFFISLVFYRYGNYNGDINTYVPNGYGVAAQPMPFEMSTDFQVDSTTFERQQIDPVLDNGLAPSLVTNGQYEMNNLE